jgi:hypothetical protein
MTMIVILDVNSVMNINIIISSHKGRLLATSPFVAHFMTISEPQQMKWRTLEHFSAFRDVQKPWKSQDRRPASFSSDQVL